MVISLNLASIGIGLIILVGLGIPFLIFLGIAIGAGFGVNSARKRSKYKKYEKTGARELDKDVIRSESDQLAERQKNLNRISMVDEEQSEKPINDSIDIDEISRKLSEQNINYAKSDRLDDVVLQHKAGEVTGENQNKHSEEIEQQSFFDLIDEKDNDKNNKGNNVSGAEKNSESIYEIAPTKLPEQNNKTESDSEFVDEITDEEIEELFNK